LKPGEEKKGQRGFAKMVPSESPSQPTGSEGNCAKAVFRAEGKERGSRRVERTIKHDAKSLQESGGLCAVIWGGLEGAQTGYNSPKAKEAKYPWPHIDHGQKVF